MLMYHAVFQNKFYFEETLTFKKKNYGVYQSIKMLRF